MSRPDWRLLIYLRNQENSKKSLSWLWHIIKKKKHIKYKNHTRNYKMRILIGFLLLCLQGKNNFRKRKKQDWGAFQSKRLHCFMTWLEIDSIANKFVIDVYCRCLQILCQIAFSSLANYFRSDRKKQFRIKSVGIYSRRL